MQSSTAKKEVQKYASKIAHKHLDKSGLSWNNVFWLGKIKIELLGINSVHNIAKKKGCMCDPKNTRSTLIWGFSANSTGELHIIKRNMNGAMYWEILVTSQDTESEKMDVSTRL